MARSDLAVVITASDLASKAFRSLDTSLDTTNRKLKALSSGLDAVGNRMTLGITVPFAAVGAAAFKMASDMVESENLFTVAMGEMAGAAREWSESLRNQLGLNAVELRKSAGTFNVMFTAMGLGKQAAFDMSTGLTKLSHDMASFFNISSEEAFTKLRAGIVGETEPLRALGIVILETTVKQWALTNGLIKHGEELSESQKILARYGLIMESTAKAQGDLARTMDSPANQLRIFQSRLQEVGQTAGREFLPAVSSALLWINNVGFPAVIEGMGNFKTAWADMSDEARTRVLFVAGLLVTGGPLMKGLSVAVSGVRLFARSWVLVPLAATAAGAMVADMLGRLIDTLGELQSGWLNWWASVADTVGANSLAAELRGQALEGARWADRFRELTSIGHTTAKALELVEQGFDAALGKAEDFTVDGLKGLIDQLNQATGMSRRLTEDNDILGKSFVAMTPPVNTVKAAWNDAAGAMDGAKKKADDLGVSAAQLVSALVTLHPATMAASAAVETWKSRIADVTLALRANQDQLRAAQSELSGMQSRLSDLNSELSAAKARLDDLKAPKLVGMGALDTQIAALEALQKRVRLAEMKGAPVESILKSMPLSAEFTKILEKLGALSSGGLFGPFVLGADSIAQMIEQLKLGGDIKFGEKLDELKKAAEGANEELTFEEALKAITETKARIGELTGAVSAQEEAIKSQRAMVESLQAIQDSLNATLDTYRQRLETAERNLGLMTDALKLAFDWLVSDRTKMVEMGGEAAVQAGVIDQATRQLLTDIDEFASGVKTTTDTNLAAVVSAYQAAVDEALKQLARLPSEVTTRINRVEVTTPTTSTPAGGTSVQSFGFGPPVAAGGTVNVNLTINGSVMTEQDLVETVRRGFVRLGQRNVNILGGLT